MTSPRPDRPYFEAWRKRTGRQLAVSGRLSQVAAILAAETDKSPDHWREKLQSLLQGDILPTIDLVTRIDSLLKAPARPSEKNDSHQGSLF